MDEQGDSPRLPTKAECDELYTKARNSLDGRAPPFVPGVGRLSQDLNSTDFKGDPPEESEPEVQYRGKLVVRTHRRFSSHSSGRSDAGSPASYIGSRSNAGSPASYMASRGNAESPESLTAAGSNAGSPTSSLAAAADAVGSPKDEPEPEIVRRGKVVIRSHRNLAPLGASQVVTLPGKGQQQANTLSMDISPPRSLAPRPQEDDNDGRKTRHPAATASARETSAVGASDEDSGDDSSSPTKRGEISVVGASDKDSGDDNSGPPKPEEVMAVGASDEDSGDDSSSPTKRGEISAAGSSGKDNGDDNSGPTKREEVSAVGASDKDSGDDSSSPTKRGEISAAGSSGKDSGDDNSGPTKREEVSVVGDSDKDSGDDSSSSKKREDISDVGASGKDSGDNDSGPTKREDMSDVGDSDKDSGGDSERPIKPAEVRAEAADVLDLRVFCGTWNVAGRKLDSAEDMGLWLDVDKLDEEGDTSVPPDIFVIGFQEVVELSAQNVVMDSFLDKQSRTNSLQWFTHVYAYLAQYGERYGVRYAMVTEQRLLGTYVLIMAKEDLCPKIANVQTAVVPTGLGGYLGNKGAVAVRLEVGGRSSLCFVCVHMAAHREYVLARNAEYKLISSKPIFADTDGRLPADEVEDPVGKDKEKDKAQDRWQGSTWGSLFGAAGQGGRSGGMSPTRNSEVKKAIRAAMAFGLPKRGGGGDGLPAGGVSSGNGEIDGNGSEAEKGARPAEEFEGDDFAWMPSDEGMSAVLPKTKTVLQADIVFWIGDLNYRITEETPDQEVFEMLQNDDLETLRRVVGLDQLTIARASGTAFQEFQEGPLCFPPSYKYIPGTKEYDQRRVRSPEKKVRCPSWCDRVLYTMGMQGGDSVRRLGLERYWSSGPLVSDHMPVSALFRTSLACAPQRTVTEPGVDVEPLSPRRAAAKAESELSPFARVVLEPPTLVLVLDQTPSLSAVTEISNTGGIKGTFHVCKDSLPGWISLDGSERGELEPGEKVEIAIVIDAAEAEAAARIESNNDSESDTHRPAACAVLRVEVDGGGSGTMLPVVCNLGDI
ncbi:unnamed protein product [Ectocarpus sp. 12 AP-2014]